MGKGVCSVGITGEGREGPAPNAIIGPLIGEKKQVPGGPVCGPPIGLLLRETRAIKAPVHPFLSISMHDNTEIIMDSLGPYIMLLLVFPGIRFNNQV